MWYQANIVHSYIPLVIFFTEVSEKRTIMFCKILPQRNITPPRSMMMAYYPRYRAWVTICTNIYCLHALTLLSQRNDAWLLLMSVFWKTVEPGVCYLRGYICRLMVSWTKTSVIDSVRLILLPQGIHFLCGLFISRMSCIKHGRLDCWWFIMTLKTKRSCSIMADTHRNLYSRIP